MITITHEEFRSAIDREVAQALADQHAVIKACATLIKRIEDRSDYTALLARHNALVEAVKKMMSKAVCDQSGLHVTVFCTVDEWIALAALAGEG